MKIQMESIPLDQYGFVAEKLKCCFPRTGTLYNILKLNVAMECYADMHNADMPTVVIMLKEWWPRSILIHAKHSDLQNVLENTPCIDWSKLLFFIDIREDELPILQAVTEKHRGKLRGADLNSFIIDSMDVMQKPEIPDGMEIVPLGVQHTDLVYELWPYSLHVPKKESLAACLTAWGGRALARKDTGQLTSWCAVNDLGRLGFLHTRAEYRRKGYGKIVVYHLAEAMLKDGLVPLVHVNCHNPPSAQLFSQLGFRKEGFVLHIFYIPNSDEAREEYRKLEELYRSRNLPVKLRW